jgi:hypothetical protein
LSQEYEPLLDGTLGELSIDPTSLFLIKKTCKPMHVRSFAVSRSMIQQLCKEIARLVEIGVVKDDYIAVWAYKIVAPWQRCICILLNSDSNSKALGFLTSGFP